MCIVAFAINQHPDYPLILIANRDEYTARATQALHLWQTAPAIAAGKDLQAGGTWMGINENGRWAAITNFRDPTLAVGAISRGEIVTQCLTSKKSLSDFFLQLAENADQYSGFNFVAGEVSTDSALLFSNIDQQIYSLNNGVFVVSNGLFTDDWPKMSQLKQSLTQHMHHPQFSTLFDLLQHNEQHDFERLPNTKIDKELEQKLSSVFIQPFNIQNRLYGTRSSTIILAEKNQAHIEERQFEGDKAICHHVELTLNSNLGSRTSNP